MFAYCGNNPVVRADESGTFFDFIMDAVSIICDVVDIISDPTDVVAWGSLVLDVGCAIVPGISGGGTVLKAAAKVDDVVDTINAVDNVTDTIRIVDNATDTIKHTDNALDTAKSIYQSADKASDLRTATGSYEILYKSGNNYVGKGGFNRALNSAERYCKNGADEVVSIFWQYAPDTRTAFIDEYIMQCKRGVLSSNKNAMTYNKIWSPGKKYFEMG